MISLRILGTEEAKNELASLGEDVDDFVVQTQSKIDETVRSYTAVASNAFKGISVLDEKNKSIAYLTTGQSVPNDIEVASVPKLLMMLNGFKINRDHIEERFSN